MTIRNGKAARKRRFFGFWRPCHRHPEAVESLAKRRTPVEGSMHSVSIHRAAGEFIDPSPRKKRGPQDDRACKMTTWKMPALGRKLNEHFVLRHRRPVAAATACTNKVLEGRSQALDHSRELAHGRDNRLMHYV